MKTLILILGLAGTVLAQQTKIEKWEINCSKDPIDDIKRCSIYQGNLWVWMSDKRFLDSVKVGMGDNDPGSWVAVRVDDKPAFEAKGQFARAASADIVSQLRSGQKVTTRYSIFAGGMPTLTFDLKGFAESLKYVDEFLGRTSNQNPGITKANFDKIKTGMSYAEVVEILGKGGELISEGDIGGVIAKMYQWKAGKNDGGALGANMNAMFQDDKLVTKAQYGLK